jgi:enoyl-CoA hydratase/carnithine racemase
MSAAVRYEAEGPIAVITLNRPAELNAVNLEVCDAVFAALKKIESDPQIRVAILTGSGAAFCVGADPKAVAAGEGPAIVDHRGGFGGFVRFDRTKPVIAAVNGDAFGGGLELVLACELAVASTQAQFGVPEVTAGLMAGGGGAIHLPVDLLPKVGLRMLLTGRFDAKKTR